MQHNPAFHTSYRGWSGGAMVLGKLAVSGHPTPLDAVWVGDGVELFFSYLSFPFSFSFSLGDGPI